MIPYSRTKWALVYCEVLCFLEADVFASDTVKVGNYWPTISSFWIVGLSSLQGNWDIKRERPEGQSDC